MTQTITGEITEVLPKRSGVSKSGNEWTSQQYVISDANGEKIVFDVFGQQKIDEYNLMVGSKASVTVKIESKKWNDKWFTSANCVECISNTSKQGPQEQNNQSSVQYQNAQPQRPQYVVSQPTKTSDLPF